MRDTTKKLSGPAKDKFFERLYAIEPGVDEATAARLTRRSAETFSSVHVRPKAYADVRKAAPRKLAAGLPGGDARAKETPEATPTPGLPPEPAPARASTAPLTPAAKVAGPKFDPYAFGLVPVFQKEGREALLARLGEIADADHLRQLARAQQVSLPQPLRTGEVALDVLRAAIVDAVAKRVADRRAAAG